MSTAPISPSFILSAGPLERPDPVSVQPGVILLELLGCRDAVQRDLCADLGDAEPDPAHS